MMGKCKLYYHYNTIPIYPDCCVTIQRYCQAIFSMEVLCSPFTQLTFDCTLYYLAFDTA